MNGRIDEFLSDWEGWVSERWLAASAAEEEWRSLSEYSFNKRSILAAKFAFRLWVIAELENWAKYNTGG